MATCDACGAQLERGWAFCEGCGRGLAAVSMPVPAPAWPSPVPPLAYSPAPGRTASPEANERRRTASTPLEIVTGCLTGVAGAFFLLSILTQASDLVDSPKFFVARGLGAIVVLGVAAIALFGWPRIGQAAIIGLALGRLAELMRVLDDQGSGVSRSLHLLAFVFLLGATGTALGAVLSDRGLRIAGQRDLIPLLPIGATAGLVYVVANVVQGYPESFFGDVGVFPAWATGLVNLAMLLEIVFVFAAATVAGVLLPRRVAAGLLVGVTVGVSLRTIHYVAVAGFSGIGENILRLFAIALLVAFALVVGLVGDRLTTSVAR